MQTLTIANEKGGVGKTTLSCLLAFYLAEKRGGRVAAIDVDGQGNLSHTLRQYRIEVPATALFQDEPIALPAVRKTIAVFPATPKLKNLEIGTEQVQHQRVRTFMAQVDALSEHFDYCLIDPPPTAGMRLVATLAAAEYVTMPIELEEYSREGVKNMLQTIFGVRAEYNPRLKFIGILPNRVMKTQPRQRSALIDLFAHYSDYLLPGQVAVTTRSAIPRALEEGKPVWQLPNAVGHDASTEVLRTFEAIMTAIAPQADTQAGPEAQTA